MKSNEIKYFLDIMFNDYNSFQSINGISNASNINYMLVADVLSENTELLASIVEKNLVRKFCSISHTNSRNSNQSNRIV
jgi:hypothetical protein